MISNNFEISPHPSHSVIFGAPRRLGILVRSRKFCDQINSIVIELNVDKRTAGLLILPDRASSTSHSNETISVVTQTRSPTMNFNQSFLLTPDKAGAVNEPSKRKMVPARDLNLIGARSVPWGNLGAVHGTSHSSKPHNYS